MQIHIQKPRIPGLSPQEHELIIARQRRCAQVGLDYTIIRQRMHSSRKSFEAIFTAMGGIEREHDLTLSPHEAELSRRRRAWQLDLHNAAREG